MQKFRIILLFTATAFSIYPALADNHNMSSSAKKPCAAVMHACAAAGYTRSKTGNKRIGQDCMKPIIMGKTVQGVTVDASAVKACREAKLHKMKQANTRPS